MENTFDLNNFKFISKYYTNDTIGGDFCYAINNDTFMNECYLKKPDTNWIVVNPFNEMDASELITFATN